MRKLSLAAACVTLAIAMPTLAQSPEDTTITDLKKELQALREEIANLRKLRDLDLRILSDRLDRIEKLAERPTKQNTKFGPVGTNSGIVRLENLMTVPAYVTIDGMMYTVPPGRSRTLPNMQAGTISYTLGGEGMLTGPMRRTLVNP
ncbi:MAG: hypothetical protein KGQ60_19585, partial [Planctomycetes bacterium]|nr:hypothetical protein [Planctomycetota bacterium]